MSLYKNAKGIIHELNDQDVKVKKWAKSDQITRLDTKEIEAYKISRGIGVKKVKAVVQKNDEPKTREIDILREEYLSLYAEQANPQWNVSTLKKKIAETEPSE